MNVERFWSRVDKASGPDTCWEYNGPRSTSGYGVYNHKSANRIAYELAAGTIPEGMEICHTCDNPACVRNDDEGWYELNGVLHPRRGHLWLGTHQDNMADMAQKGRAHTLRGESSTKAKLTRDDVAAIRTAHALGSHQSALAREYGVSSYAIYAILRGINWVNEPDS